MSLANLKKNEINKILGVDASTNSFAFCLMNGKEPVKWGEITFEGSNVYERILDAKRKIHAIKSEIDYDFVAIEAAVSVRSVATGLKMAYMFGTIMSELLSDKINVVEVHPLKWQGYIGNPNFTKGEKTQLKNDFPGKSDNWYKAKAREIRKEKTMKFVESIGIKTSNDNVADAAGIAWWAANEAL